MRAGSFGAVFIRTSFRTVSRATLRLTFSDLFTTILGHGAGRDLRGLPPLRAVGRCDLVSAGGVRARHGRAERGRQGAGDDAVPGSARTDDRWAHARGVREVRGEPPAGPERRH